MFTQLTKTHAKYFASAAVVLALVGFFITRPAFAKLSANTIDPVAIVAHHGRQLLLTGPVSCTHGERSYLRVTVTQRSTGAVAEGSAFLTCTGGVQQWEVQASAQGEPAFAEGPATAVAMASSIAGGRATDAHQWLVNITLVKQ